MIVTMPDPNPGRCLNSRPSVDAYGYPTSKRCLDYEAASHVCSFPPDPERLPASTQAGGTSAAAAPIQPWVHPELVSVA